MPDSADASSIRSPLSSICELLGCSPLKMASAVAISILLDQLQVLPMFVQTLLIRCAQKRSVDAPLLNCIRCGSIFMVTKIVEPVCGLTPPSESRPGLVDRSQESARRGQVRLGCLIGQPRLPGKSVVAPDRK